MNYETHTFQLEEKNELQAQKTRTWGMECVLEKEQPNCRQFHWLWGLSNAQDSFSAMTPVSVEISVDQTICDVMLFPPNLHHTW